LVTTALALTAPFGEVELSARQDPAARLAAQKADAVKGVDEMAKLAQEMVDSVFSFGELGMQEVET
jgi:aminobenzoyl-glutamate utilization protein B